MKSLAALLLLGSGTFASADKQDLRIDGYVGYGVVDGVSQNLIRNQNGKLQLSNFPEKQRISNLL